MTIADAQDGDIQAAPPPGGARTLPHHVCTELNAVFQVHLRFSSLIIDSFFMFKLGYNPEPSQ